MDHAIYFSRTHGNVLTLRPPDNSACLKAIIFIYVVFEYPKHVFYLVGKNMLQSNDINMHDPCDCLLIRI